MLCLIDVGNTNIVFGLSKQGALIKKWRMATNPSFTEDELIAFLAPLLDQSNIKISDINGMMISTVVPRLLFALKKLAEQHFKCKPTIMGSNNFKHDIKIKLDNPTELGTDLLANAVAALTLYKHDMLILDFGTATTFTVVTQRREFLGGAIAPGINLSMQALKNAAAQLSDVMILKPEKVCGKNTKACMQSGIYFGYLGLIEGIIKRIKQEYAKPLKVVATGGLANLFTAETKEINYIESDLTLIGLEYLYNLNNK